MAGIFTRSQWVAESNPAYAGKTPRPLKAECHDGSPFITIRCDCGEALHQHETQVAHVPSTTEVASRCPHCRRLLVFPPGFFAAAFQRLRDDGWIAP